MRAVVFDMDGVLFDTEQLCMKSWCETAKEQGFSQMEILFPRCIGSNSTDTEVIVKDFYGEDFPYKSFREIASKWFWQYIDQNGLPMKEGVRELLIFLKEEGFKIGLASSTRKDSIVKHLHQANISDYFSVIVSGDMVLHSKPNPDIYLMACEQMGVSPIETYAIEDSHNGIRAAYRAGMLPIMVPDMLPPNEEMRNISCLICDNLLEVKEFLIKELQENK